MPIGWSVSENGSHTFSDDGTRLYFGTAPKPVKEPEDTLWMRKNTRLISGHGMTDRSSQCRKNSLIRIETDIPGSIPYKQEYYDPACRYLIPTVRVDPKSTSSYVLCISDRKYQKLSSWETRRYSDYYVVNEETGSRTEILRAYPSQVVLSRPENMYLSGHLKKNSGKYCPKQGKFHK